MVFTRTTDAAMTGLVKQLDQLVVANRENRLIAIVVFLGKDADATRKAAVAFGKKHKITNVTLATPHAGETQNGYAKLKLNPKVKTTVVITKRKRIVTANYVFGSSDLDDSATKQIIAGTQATISGKPVPRLSDVKTARPARARRPASAKVSVIPVNNRVVGQFGVSSVKETPSASVLPVAALEPLPVVAAQPGIRPVPSPPGRRAPRLADRFSKWKGRWKVEFANGIHQVHEFKTDCTATVKSHTLNWSSQGRVKFEGESMMVTYRDNRVERWTRVGTRMVVEHWYPASRYPKAAPVVGIGVRHATPSTAPVDLSDLAPARVNTTTDGTWGFGNKGLSTPIHSATILARAGKTHRLAVSPNGTMLAAYGSDHVLRMWDTENGRLLWNSPRPIEGGTRLMFRNQGRSLIWGGGHTVVTSMSVANKEVKEISRSRSAKIVDLSVTPDDKRMAICYTDGKIELWDFANRKLLRTIAAHTGRAKYIYTVTLSRDGRLVASGGLDNAVRIWDFETGALRGSGSDTAAVLVTAFSPDGNTLAFGNNGNQVKLWTFESDALQAVQPHSLAVRAIAVNPFGKVLATAGTDKAVRLYGIQSGKLMRSLPTAVARNVNCLAYSADGSVLAAAGDGKTIHLWRFKTK